MLRYATPEKLVVKFSGKIFATVFSRRIFPAREFRELIARGLALVLSHPRKDFAGMKGRDAVGCNVCRWNVRQVKRR